MKKIFMSLFNNCKSIIAKFKSKTQSEKNIFAVAQDSKIEDAIRLLEQIKKIDPNFGPDLERSRKQLNDALDILKANGKSKEEKFERFYESYLAPQSNKKQNDEVLKKRYLDILNSNINQLPN